MNFFIKALPFSQIDTAIARLGISAAKDKKRFEGVEITTRIAYDPDEEFPGLRRLYGHLARCARNLFRNEYCGVVVLDISEWLGHEADNNFGTLLDYVSESPAVFCLLVRSRNADDAELGRLEAVVSRSVGARIIDVRKEEEAQYAQEIRQFLLAGLVEVAPELLTPIAEMVDKAMLLPGFGRNTPTLLASELLRFLRGASSSSAKALSAELLDEYIKDSRYLVDNFPKARIGLTERGCVR